MHGSQILEILKKRENWYVAFSYVAGTMMLLTLYQTINAQTQAAVIL